MEKIVGAIREISGDRYQPLRELISDAPHPRKSEIIRYLNGAKVIAAAAGAMRDVMTGEYTGRELLIHSDGEYRWRSDTQYYVEKYNMSLPENFIRHALGQ